MKNEEKTIRSEKLIIRKCHVCSSITESSKELERCIKCNKAYLPLNYFGKIHSKSDKEYRELFCESEHLHEDDLVKGLFVLW